MKKAELLKRIEELEEKVKQLEVRSVPEFKFYPPIQTETVTVPFQPFWNQPGTAMPMPPQPLITCTKYSAYE